MSPSCNQQTIDFIVKEGDPEMAVVEDDIRKNLEVIGIKVNTKFLNETEYIKAELNGHYNLLFTRTWGAPYDPHSYMASWAVPSHVEYSAIGGLEPPVSRESLLAKIEKVQTELDEAKIQAQWKEILEVVHSQAIFMPLWGTRIPYVLNRRLAGFVPAEQVFSIPVNTIQVLSGPTNVTVSPGVGSLFSGTGPINPHQYSPNQLWAQDWIYEGLVNYGQDGVIIPGLARMWKVEPTSEGQRVTFELRQGVQFHDGTLFNCEAVRLNFDHVLNDVVKQRHQWFGAGKYIQSWTCPSEYEFVLETNATFYPLLQELTYIRPLRFASPSAFAQGNASDPLLHNSCESGDFGEKWKFLEEDVECLGLSAPIGTGPFKFVSRETDADGADTKVVFAAHENYWGQVPAIKTLTVVKYDSTDAVEAALMSGKLDMALGIGPLTAKQVQKLKFSHSDQFDVRHSEVIQHALLVFNTNRSPTNDALVRRSIIHAIDKATFLEQEFAGLEQPVTQLLPQTAPYCNVDLNPKWGYDIEKAKLLSCPADAIKIVDSSLETSAIVGIVIGVGIILGLVAFVARMIYHERTGTPLFKSVQKSEVEMA